MTIPLGEEQQSDDSCHDPLSMLSFEKTDELARQKDLFDPEAPAMDDTVVKRSTFSGTLEDCYSDCPLLQEVSVDRLPSQFIHLLEGRCEDSLGKVVFYPGYIPHNPCDAACFTFLCTMVVVGASMAPTLLVIIIFVYTVGRDRDKAILPYIAPVSAFFILRYSCSLAYEDACSAYKKRKALFARDSQGNPKPWPGDWRAGVYTTRLGLLEFDGEDKVWLFPVDSIEMVELQGHSKLQTTLWIRSPGSEGTIALHKLSNLDQPSKGKEIQRWHDPATSITRRRNYSKME